MYLLSQALAWDPYGQVPEAMPKDILSVVELAWALGDESPTGHFVNQGDGD